MTERTPALLVAGGSIAVTGQVTANGSADARAGTRIGAHAAEDAKRDDDRPQRFIRPLASGDRTITQTPDGNPIW